MIAAIYARKRSAVVVLALVGLLLVVALAGAEDRTRVDFFDRDGRRQGYAVVERETGRVDFYDVNSRRTGYGEVDERGRVERFKLDGTRDTETAVPLPRRGAR